MKATSRKFLKTTVSSLLIAGLVNIALAAPPAPATRTIFLPRAQGDFDTAMNVAYHPGFDQYYASSGGNPDHTAYVYDNAGAIIHTQQPINIDVRAWNYNPHSGLLEVVSYDALNGGPQRGLVDAQLDGAGLLTGGASNLLFNMPGNIGDQTMPAYDPNTDRFYSRESGDMVNVVDRFDGSFVSTITLDFAGSGLSGATQYAIGHSPVANWLIVTDYVADTAVVFDMSGNYVGTFVLDIDVDSSYGMGFTNNQVFVYDEERNGWQGYDIGIEPPFEPVDVPVPLLSVSGLLALIAGLLILALLALRTPLRNRP